MGLVLRVALCCPLFVSYSVCVPIVVFAGSVLLLDLLGARLRLVMFCSYVLYLGRLVVVTFFRLLPWAFFNRGHTKFLFGFLVKVCEVGVIIPVIFVLLSKCCMNLWNENELMPVKLDERRENDFCLR